MDSHVPSYRVVETVARKEGVSPTELSPPLFSVVDPDALDSLVQAGSDSNPEEVEIEFTYLDYVVQIRNDPTVSISVRDGDASMDNPDSVPDRRASFEE
ncbi:HalOD1 output domain-containing protein [Natrarchaeobius sp. A-rgal3]|uniref:HalOD1 output domain-containing protein n=1 Tax=Natrarchaeobius versutus TaxID=1679078 RepID=UPI00350ED695